MILYKIYVPDGGITMSENNKKFTRDCILQKFEPVLLNSQKVPEDVHTLTMSGFSGVKICFAIFEETDTTRKMKLLTDKCVETYGISDDDLVTCMNLNRYLYKFDTLSNVLQIQGCNDFQIYALTNDRMSFGSGMICVDSIFRKVVERIGCDFYILPSSVHELLFVPVDDFDEDESAEEIENYLLEMVWEVNHTQVEPNERLSNNIYYVDSKSLEFRTIRAKRLI